MNINMTRFRPSCYTYHRCRNELAQTYVQQSNAKKQQNTNCIWQLQRRLINLIGNYPICFPASCNPSTAPPTTVSHQRQHDQLLRPSQTDFLSQVESTTSLGHIDQEPTHRTRRMQDFYQCPFMISWTSFGWLIKMDFKSTMPKQLTFDSIKNPHES